MTLLPLKGSVSLNMAICFDCTVLIFVMKILLKDTSFQTDTGYILSRSAISNLCW